MKNIKDINKTGRVVIKIGTSTLTHKTGNLNIRRFEQLVKIIADLRNSGREIILVSSGAIAIGAGKMGLAAKPDTVAEKQALAAIGQCELMYLYDQAFGEYNQNVAQMLITYDAIASDQGRVNFCNTFESLLKYGTIPIVNENDTASTEELENGDNDTLSAMVASVVDADLLILLTDIDGLYTANPAKDPGAEKFEVITEITDEIRAACGDTGDGFGTGGMVTKLAAAERAFAGGFDMAILSSDDPGVLYDFFDGNNKGTFFKVREED